ncbi:hypothetical protein [Bradyrhizobium sp. URHD0069]|uniref:hypothetical protein n=1 Tax=Bradyrhizobium sp. URHD0069 TaxID=1380355 RepID=UPI00069019DA|nr:hypothetical protein [Bradyrhizobium sp. URHD0069]
MTKRGVLGAVAVLGILIGTPAMAQEAMQEPGAYAQAHPWANDYYYDYGYGGPGFWPADVAAGVIGGAIGTAGVIATAPFRAGDPYAPYGRSRVYDDSYAYYGDRPVRRMARCGLQPGATYLGPDGRWYPC